MKVQEARYMYRMFLYSCQSKVFGHFIAFLICSNRMWLMEEPASRNKLSFCLALKWFDSRFNLNTLRILTTDNALGRLILEVKDQHANHSLNFIHQLTLSGGWLCVMMVSSKLWNLINVDVPFKHRDNLHTGAPPNACLRSPSSWVPVWWGCPASRSALL